MAFYPENGHFWLKMAKNGQKIASFGQKLLFFCMPPYEAERHRPAPRLWASFSRAAPHVQLLRQYQDKYAIFHLEFENYWLSPTHFH